jgi:hypothetical protein
MKCMKTRKYVKMKEQLIPRKIDLSVARITGDTPEKAALSLLTVLSSTLASQPTRRTFRLLSADNSTGNYVRFSNILTECRLMVVK